MFFFVCSLPLAQIRSTKTILEKMIRQVMNSVQGGAGRSHSTLA